MNYIAKRTGESMSELRDRMSKGAIGVDEVEQALVDATSAGGQFYKGMEVASHTLSGQISTLKDDALALVGEVVQPISDAITNQLLPTAIESIQGLMNGFKENGVAGMLQTGMDMLSNFSKGFAENFPKMIEKVGELLNRIVNYLIENAPRIIAQGGRIVINLAKGLIASIPKILSAVGQMTINIGKAIINYDWIRLGKNIVKGLGNGIIAMKDWIVEKIKNLGKTMVDKFKSFFGIHSPSKLMADEIGQYLPLGIMKGFNKYLPKATDKMESGLSSAMSNLRTSAIVSVSSGANVGEYGGLSRTYSINQTFINNEGTSPSEMAQQTINASRRLEWA